MMAREPPRRSRGFALTPAPAPELVRKGIEAAEADLVAQLTRQKETKAKSAGLQKKLAQAQLEIMRQAGVDIDALAREARELSHQLGGPSKPPLPELPGLQPEIPSRVAHPPGWTLVMPPYSYDWSSTGYIDYGPGTLSAYATRETGFLTFTGQPASDSDQVNVSYAAAAAGIYFKPQVPGVLSLLTTANIFYSFGYLANLTGAHVRGWVGSLVQGYDASNSLSETPIYQQIILFDEGSDGRSLNAHDAQQQSLNEVVNTPGFL
jgi:hypothetical protein